MSSVSRHARIILSDLYYHALKMLMNVKQNIQKERTLALAVGAPWTCYLSNRAKTLHEKLKIMLPTPCENEACSAHHNLRPDHQLPIIKCLKANAINVFKLKANCSMLGWRKDPDGTFNRNGSES